MLLCHVSHLLGQAFGSVTVDKSLIRDTLRRLVDLIHGFCDTVGIDAADVVREVLTTAL